MIVAIFGVNNNVEAFDPVMQYSDIEKSISGLEAYKNDNNLKLATLSEKQLSDIHCTITFKEAISLSRLEQICIENSIDLKVVETRHIAGGDRHTSATLFNGNFDDLEAEIGEITKGIGGGFKGVIDIYALIDSEYLDKIQKNQYVYLCDVSGDAASVGYYEKDGFERNELRFDDGLNDFPHALSWDLEELKNS